MAIDDRRQRTEENHRKNDSLSMESESSTTSITDLPESILLHILSFLPITTAIKTTAVARDWRNLWRSLLKLNFDLEEFHSHIPEKPNRDARQLFAEFVSQALLYRPRHLPIENFKLQFLFKDCDSMRSFVDFCLRYVISCQGTELDFNFITFGYSPSFRQGSSSEVEDVDEGFLNPDRYSFDVSELKNSSVKTLRLCGCNVVVPGKELLSMKINSLRKLCLQEFCTTDEDIENMMAVCGNLEVLSIENVSGFHNLKIASPNLKHLKLDTFNDDFYTGESSLEICAPSLESVKFDYTYANRYVLDGTSSLVQAHVCFWERSWKAFTFWTKVVSFVTGVTRLTTDNMWYFSLKPQSRFDRSIMSERCYKELFTGYESYDVLGLDIALKACPQLETLVLVYLYESDHDGGLEGNTEVSSIVFNMPRLKLVKMKAYGGTKNEKYLANRLKKHGVVLEKIIAFPPRASGESSHSLVL
ncbi:OLC1v1012721C3 [Oldenlandia corymbosa var. corymbosa]|uniref:OLC1v1012721C3 n=1 Tax=Oldenlandia corymbosa var. corymbosa TaxID=529605 RepID=A0AAV1DYM3_OLDCO|nr:OLC1v1012721C3 [Oldenlandia corymbosa var. corymbosa]